METQNEDVMLVPAEKAFNLVKVKTCKDGGLDVHYEITETVGNESYTNRYHVASAKDIHPDLKKLFGKIAPLMGNIFGLDFFLEMFRDAAFAKATKKQIDVANSYAESMRNNISVTGISFSGDGDNLGCVITAVYECKNGQKVALNSPRIKFNSESFGIESDLDEIAHGIIHETYLFLFKGKKAEMELFGADGNATKVDEL